MNKIKPTPFNIIVLMAFWVILVNSFTFLVRVGRTLIQKHNIISDFAFVYLMFVILVPLALAYYTLIDLTFRIDWGIKK